MRIDDAVSPTVSEAPQLLDEVDYVLLHEIKINAPIRSTEEGVIVEVRVISLDGCLNTVTRYPGTKSVLRLKNDNTQILAPAVQIPNAKLVEVWVNVLAVPNQLTAEGINVLGAVFQKLADAALDAALRKQPLIKLITDYELGKLSDKTKGQLLEGRVIGSVRISAENLATSAQMGTPLSDGTGFVLTLKPVLRKPFITPR